MPSYVLGYAVPSYVLGYAVRVLKALVCTMVLTICAVGHARLHFRLRSSCSEGDVEFAGIK